MALPQGIDRLNEYIKGVKKKLSETYANHLHKKAVNEAVEINKCVGQLGVCENEFKKTIRIQCKAVRDAREGGFNDSIQRQIVTDSAVGYLLVREAEYAVSTLRSFDTLEIAYDLLESSALTIQGKRRSAIESLAKLTKKRAGYEYIYSADAYEEKLKIVGEIFDDLIETGDIEKCIKERNSAARADVQKSSYSAPEPFPEFNARNAPISPEAQGIGRTDEDFLNDLERQGGSFDDLRDMSAPTSSSGVF